MTLNEYQDLAARTINTKLERAQIQNHALFGMAGELGEIHSIYQKVYQGHKIRAEDLLHEVGDLMWFIAELCTVNGWKLDDVGNMNIEKLRKRYPEGFEAEKSLFRED